MKYLSDGSVCVDISEFMIDFFGVIGSGFSLNKTCRMT
jgi:hypothetical protein